MIEAAEIAQATEFIDSKPEGYESPIAQGGSNVSGGQKQRLSIARAIAKDPKIFLFDDSFSALDYKTDMVLRKALHEKLRTPPLSLWRRESAPSFMPIRLSFWMTAKSPASAPMRNCWQPAGRIRKSPVPSCLRRS